MHIVRYTTNIFCDMIHLSRVSVGRMLREAGLQLDQKGSELTNDIAYCEHFNRHRNILPLHCQVPQISSSAYIAPNSTVFGDVFIGSNSYFAFGSVARGDANPIRVGINTKIGENTVLQTNVIGADLAFPLSTNIGNNVNIEHSCSLNSCIVDDDVHIGYRSVIMEGCQLERGCVIAPNSYVPAGSRIPANTIWAGTPVKYVGEVSQSDGAKLSQKESQRVRFPQKND